MSAPAAAPPAGAPPAAPGPNTPPAGGPPQPAAKGAPPAPPSSPAAEATKDKIEQAGGDAPTQKPGESDKDYEVRLAGALREFKQARREIERNKIDKQQLETMKAELEKAKNKRISKKEFVEMVKQLNEGKLELDDDEWAALPQAMRERIERLESAAQKREREEQEAAQAAQRTKEEGIVATRLKETAEDWPLIAAVDGAASDVLDWWYDVRARTGQAPDLDAVIAEVNGGLARTVATALQSEASRRFLLQAHPELIPLLTELKAASSPTSEAKGPGAANGRGAAPAHSEQPEPAPPKRPLTRLEEDEAKSARMKASYDEWVAEQRALKAAAAQKG